jgi:two-component system response regulator
MDDGTGRNAVEVLLVEDDHGDVVMITEAFEQSGAPVRLHVVGDGDQAMQFLRRGRRLRRGPQARPEQDLLTIPVLILTNSAAPPDIQRSYSLRASAYVAKPADFDGFTDAIRQIARWFLELIELPRPS